MNTEQAMIIFRITVGAIIAYVFVAIVLKSL
jgi:hypothetical protein